MKLKNLNPAPYNPRKITDEQLDRLKKALREFGDLSGIVFNKQTGNVVGGHQRIKCLPEDTPITKTKLKKPTRTGTVATGIITIDGEDYSYREVDWPERKEKAANLAANKHGGEFNEDLLAPILKELVSDENFDMSLTGFESSEIDGLLASLKSEGDGEGEDDVPEVPEDPITQVGDLYIMGSHRLLCGDSTKTGDVEKLMYGKTAALLHADPPYGMGKESDGVANDNLYREKLDAFQMDWWLAFRPAINDNASAYIWGNALDLWRLWFNKLHSSELLCLKNQVIWDKKNIPGMKSDLLNQYPITTEHCLFIAVGDQVDGNINTDDYFEGWDRVRLYLLAEVEKNNITAAKITELCGVQMYNHWFSKSQFSMIPAKHYNTLASAFPGSFSKPWEELKKTHDRAQAQFRQTVSARRSYFDNGHEIMRDVWEFPRVTGEDRHGHATPKPVAMMERVMKSSLPAGGICAEPFGGSGSTLIGAEKTGRVCYTMELLKGPCDVIVKRWEDYTGKKAKRIKA